MLKTILTSLYTRVFVAYKSTLFGMVVIAGTAIADALASSPNKIVALVGYAIGSILVAYKPKDSAPALPPAP